MSEIIDNWTLLNNRRYEHEYMRPLFEFVHEMFSDIFGEELISKEPCIVFNDPSEDNPMFIRNIQPVMIRTNAKSLKHWAQFIYHLSHEMTHYVIRQKKTDKTAIAKWFEETICEAMSLYILHRASECWGRCKLANLNYTYDNGIKAYLSEKYNETSESILRKCNSIDDLYLVEADCENNRIGRSIERNYLFDTFKEMPESIAAFIYYPLYMRGDITIDFSRWTAESEPNVFIHRLSNIQPVLTA